MAQDVPASEESVTPLNCERLPEPSCDRIYTAKVLLFTSTSDRMGGPSSTSPHLSRELRFLVSKYGTQGELGLIGGSWSALEDGGDPSVDDAVLILTAIRWTRILTGIDLSACQRWIKFAEIEYRRPPGTPF